MQTLADTMAGEFDGFYVDEQIKVSFSRCELGYLVEAEGPQFETEGLVYRELVMRDGVGWSEWVSRCECVCVRVVA